MNADRIWAVLASTRDPSSTLVNLGTIANVNENLLSFASDAAMWEFDRVATSIMGGAFAALAKGDNFQGYFVHGYL
ncbi:hypothetical protein PG990_005315 [Apiospora arundinis]|uniref:Polyketide synthase n=1 Tax=Apiospora arundinis TaxID=335852 RepID=A0ABR2J758_9PEZI